MSDTAVLDKNPIVPSAVIGQAQPQSPVGSIGGKERAPIVNTLREEGPEVQHGLTPELKDSGVKENPDKPILTQEHIEAGLQHSIPPPTALTNTVILPMTEEEIAKQLKTGQDDDSGKSLAKLLDKLIKVMTIRIGR